MTEWLCCTCIHYGGMEGDDVICDRIMSCYTSLKLECKYYKLKMSSDDIYNEIKLLMGEYIDCIHDTRLSDSQHEVYRERLNGLYELNRRIM